MKNVAESAVAPKRHLIIPDTQVRPGVPCDHIAWCAHAIVEYKPDVIVMLGDWWDFPSLNSHIKPGSLEAEGRRIQDDIDVGNEQFRILTCPLIRQLASGQGASSWNPECHFLRGNHEYRILRAVDERPELCGFLHYSLLRTPGFTVHDFLAIVEIDGIAYSHYFANVHSGRPIGGSIDNRLNKIGRTFIAGHEQGFLYGTRQFPGKLRRHGLVAGSFYLHDEDYRGAQGNGEWRGIVVLNEVCNGDFDIMPLSMDYLRRRFA